MESGLPDRELVRRAKTGDRPAFDELMRRHEREVIGVAYRMLGRYEDAVDLAQDAFYRAYRSLGAFREEASFRTWVYRIVMNLARHRRRWYARHRVSQTVSLDDPPPGAEEGQDPVGEQIAAPAADPRQETARSELRGRLTQALSWLPEPFRAAVVLRDVEGLPYEEIAGICGERVGTVKSRLHRARQMLREALKGALE